MFASSASTPPPAAFSAGTSASHSTPREITALMQAATPFLRISSVTPKAWCRNVAERNGRPDPRRGPWRYQMLFDVLSPEVWSTQGEVLYLTTDQLGRLRQVGVSTRRLKDRWRTSPMHNVTTGAPLGEHALFHSSCHRAIEEAVDAGERPPFTVSAIFGPQLQALCERTGGALATAAAQPRTTKEGLAWHVESWICSLKSSGSLPLWNIAKT